MAEEDRIRITDHNPALPHPRGLSFSTSSESPETLNFAIPLAPLTQSVPFSLVNMPAGIPMTIDITDYSTGAVRGSHQLSREDSPLGLHIESTTYVGVGSGTFKIHTNKLADFARREAKTILTAAQANLSTTLSDQGISGNELETIDLNKLLGRLEENPNAVLTTIKKVREKINTSGLSAEDQAAANSALSSFKRGIDDARYIASEITKPRPTDIFTLGAEVMVIADKTLSTDAGGTIMPFVGAGLGGECSVASISELPSPFPYCEANALVKAGVTYQSPDGLTNIEFGLSSKLPVAGTSIGGIESQENTPDVRINLGVTRKF